MTTTAHSGAVQQASDLPIVRRIGSDSLFERGIISVKFKALAGRVVYFRPFVHRRTSTASRFVERVVFVLASTGELVVSDVDATPKRSAALSNVTSVVVDGFTVALMFEASQAEHDMQLKFCSGPAGELSADVEAASSPPGGQENPTTPRSGSRVRSASRVMFADGTTPLDEPATPGHSTGRQPSILHASGMPSTLTAPQGVVPLMTLKQFVNVVLAFAPRAQLISGNANLLDMRISKPKHFAQPSPASVHLGDVGDKAAAMPSPIVSAPPEVSVVRDSSLHNERLLDLAGPAGGDGSGTAKPAFREVYSASSADAEQKQLLADFSAAVATGDAATDVASPLGAAEASGTRDTDTPRQLRAIAAAGMCLNSDGATAAEDAGGATPANPTNLTPLVQHQPGTSGFASLQPPFDGHVDATQFALPGSVHGLGADAMLNKMANMSRRSEDILRRMTNGGFGGDSGDQPPVLSDMVRKLRARRGDVQMHNLMLQGEIKGLQHQIERLLDSHQHDNPMPEFDDAPVHGHQASRGRGSPALVSSTWGDGYDDEEGNAMLKLMTPTREYNRTLNLSLIILNVCRRQRQIHLHAERDAREHYMLLQRQQQRQGADMFFSSEASALLRSSTGGANRGAMDMMSLMSLGM